MPPAETTTQQPPDSTIARTTTEQTTNSTATNFEDTTTDGEPRNPTSENATTDPVMEPGSPQSQSDSQLLAIVLGAVGGLIVVLLFGIIILLVVVILGRQRRKYSMHDRYNNIIVVAFKVPRLFGACNKHAVSHEVIWQRLVWLGLLLCVVSLQRIIQKVLSCSDACRGCA